MPAVGQQLTAAGQQQDSSRTAAGQQLATVGQRIARCVSRLGGMHALMSWASGNNVAFAALIWWVIPAAAVIGAIVYVVWVSKFQDKYSNETNRSVNNFNRFQSSFRNNSESAPATIRKNSDQA